jgi:hypothetical protein
VRRSRNIFYLVSLGSFRCRFLIAHRGLTSHQHGDRFPLHCDLNALVHGCLSSVLFAGGFRCRNAAA